MSKSFKKKPQKTRKQHTEDVLIELENLANLQLAVQKKKTHQTIQEYIRLLKLTKAE